MAKVSVYNKEGKEAGKIDLADTIFGVTPREAVIHQVYLARMANARQPWAHTKDKSEVSGGGKKPWKQKGTGRARHGSIRSPIWKGGGVTFGPLNIRNYTQKVNKKMNNQAVKMCFSGKVNEEKFLVLEDFISDGKTKIVSDLRKKLPGNGKTTLFITSGKDENLLRAANNVPNIDVGRAEDINVVDLLHHQYVITTKEAINAIEERFAK